MEYVEIVWIGPKTGSGYPTNLQRGGTVQLIIMILYTQFEIIPSSRSREMCDENWTCGFQPENHLSWLGKQEVDVRQTWKGEAWYN